MDAQQAPERRHEEIGKTKQETKDTHSVETLVKTLGRALINQEEYMENLGTDAYVNMLREKNNALVNLVKGNHDLTLRTIKYLELLIARRVEDQEVFDNINDVVVRVAKAGGVTQEEIDSAVDEAQGKSKEPGEVKEPASNQANKKAKRPDDFFGRYERGRVDRQPRRTDKRRRRTGRGRTRRGGRGYYRGE